MHLHTHLTLPSLGRQHHAKGNIDGVPELEAKEPCFHGPTTNCEGHTTPYNESPFSGVLPAMMSTTTNRDTLQYESMGVIHDVKSCNTPVTLLTNFRLVLGHALISIRILRFPELIFHAQTWM